MSIVSTPGKKELKSWIRKKTKLLIFTFIQFLQATPLIAGLAVAATALAGRYSIQAWQAYKARPIVPRMRKFYEGGFQPTMNRREAALILGVRCTLHKAFIISEPQSVVDYVFLLMIMNTSIQLFSAF